MKLTFLGVGGAFAPTSIGNSNMFFTADSGKVLMLDFGRTAPDIWCGEMGHPYHLIDALWISHLHADHIGGLELLALGRYFVPPVSRPKLFMIPSLMRELWEHSLRGGLETLEGKIAALTDYFDCHLVEPNHYFLWEGYRFQPVQMVHVVSGYMFQPSYGLLVGRPAPANTLTPYGFSGEPTFITTDTQFAPSQLKHFYHASSLIFHDCETSPIRSNVHAHYDDLKTLPPDVKKKMWLYHHGKLVETVKKDGFAGFVTKGQMFDV